MIKKYKLFQSFDLSKMNSKNPLTSEYARYISASRLELEDLELEGRQINLLQVAKSEGDEEAIEVFKYLNRWIFKQLYGYQGGNQAIRSKELAKLIPYLFEYGL